jgi:hypothetical protein
MILKLQQRNGLGRIPFVPVGIQYEPQAQSLPRAVQVRVGKPLGAPEADQAPALTHAIMSEIARLCQGPEKGQ